ncbi:MAG: acyl-CoA thioesterase [Acidimicrobiia bacterium]|nr:acyl-CoA thioesterase [Acidimicrobiia bacterium]
MEAGQGQAAPKTPEKRGESADWQDAWPVRGILQGEAAPSAGVDALRAEGFSTLFDVEPIPEDEDAYQDHLNNTAAVRIFNDLRIAYVAMRFAPDWPRFMRRSNLTLVVRELHVSYDSEGWMHERYVGATRVEHVRGKALVLDQRLVEATTGRSLCRAWVVQLVISAEGRVMDCPEMYLEMVGKVQGAPVPHLDAARTEWGPPA